MKCQASNEIPLRPVEIEGAIGVSMRWLISQKEAPNFAMRLFEVAQDGHTPLHTHPGEHEIFVLDGQGEMTYEDAKKPFQAGYVILVEPNKLHQFTPHRSQDDCSWSRSAGSGIPARAP